MGVITCGMCRSEFEEDRGQATCQACPLSRACKFIRCPECGYENPAVPSWVKTLRDMVQYESRKRDQAV